MGRGGDGAMGRWGEGAMGRGGERKATEGSTATGVAAKPSAALLAVSAF